MLALSLVVLAVEAVVAWITGSLALLADAGHVLGDSAGIVMALAAISAAQRGGRPGSRRTFGYHRTEVIAAGLNGLLLLVLAGWIVVSAIRRLGDAPELEGGLVLAAGAVGLVINVIGLLLLRAGAAGEHERPRRLPRGARRRARLGRGAGLGRRHPDDRLVRRRPRRLAASSPR